MSAWLAFVVAIFSLCAPAISHAASTGFDHFTTGFELLGQHKDVPCASCHVGGIFKGTPHDCFSCHAAGSRIGATAKPSNHMLSGNNCADCHTPFGWKPVAKFNHLNVLGTCTSCHNKVQTIGKPANHIPTTSDCSTCHLVTLPWKAARFNHVGVTGNCSACHDNIHAPGQPKGHVPSQQPCETCHSPSNFTTFAGTAMNHAGITQNCQACHETGMTWVGVTMVDRPTAAQDPVHPRTGDCASCHAGFNPGDFLNTKTPVGHLPTTQPCTTCHTKLPDYTLYTMGATGHAGITGNCATCHATGLSFLNMAPPALKEPPSNHLPINGIACESCHSASNFTSFAGTAMNHTGITTGCQACHETGMSWFGVTMVDRPTLAQDPLHPTVAAGADCSQCHAGTNVGDFNKNAKPANHIPTTTQPCAQCHTAMPDFSQYVMGATGHAGFSSNCAACHAANLSFKNMAPPTLKEPPSNHLPINGIACESCHANTNFVSFTGTAMNHAGITSGCQNCHETAMTWFGVTMVDRPTAAQDPIHPTSGDCVSCHAGFGVGAFNIPTKLPPNHLPTTQSCATCHTAIPTWTTYVMGNQGHTGISANCAQCHAANLSFLNMAPPTLKEPPGNHIPINGIACESCHTNNNFTTFAGAVMNHAGITSGCQACHEAGMTWGGVTNLIVRPSPAQDPIHPTGGDCATCHAGFTAGAFNTPTTLPPNHLPTTQPCANCHTAIPTWTTYVMGNQGHAGITSNCAACHASNLSFLNVAPPTLKEPPSNHLPINGIACESCHSNSNFTNFSGTAMNHAGITSGCQNCHETSMSWFGVTMVDRPTLAQDPAHPTTGDCATCHAGFNVGDFNNVKLPTGHLPTTQSCVTCHTKVPDYTTYTMGATGHVGITSGCATCHATGLSFLNIAPPALKEPPSNHLPINGIACESCHANSNFTTFSGTAMNHAGITSGCTNCHETGMSWFGVTMVDRPTTAQDPVHPTTGDCITCHGGFNVGDFNNVKLPTGHLPTTQACATCHTKLPDYTQYVMGTTGHTGISTGCATCHASGLSFLNIAPPALKEPPSNHLPINGIACESCHSATNFAAFSGTAMNHAGITSGCQACHETGKSWYGVTMVDRPTPAQDPLHPTAVAGPDCSTCHSGTNVGDFNKNAKPSNHIPTSMACATCHTAIPTFSQYVMGATGHAGITTGCATCHASGLSFYNMAPPVLKEPPSNHLPINGIACESCHSNSNFTAFSGTAMNHAGITTGCQNCHETGMSWYGVTMVDRPTAAQDSIHPTTGDCATCHSGFTVGAFNIPTKLPTNHIPSSLVCANCHTAIPTWATYVMGSAGHTGIATGCATCHAANLSFLNMAPPTLKEPPSNHLPINGIACESCHSPSNFTNFTGTAMNHAGITNNCQACHETGMAWFGVTMVDRPTPAQDAAHPTAVSVGGADCSNCHSGFNVGDFGKNTKPTNHIPTSAACSVCHTTAGDYTTYTSNLTTLHSAVATTCSTCHADGKGPFAGVSTFKIVQMSTKGLHIPITNAGVAVECSGCHKTVTAFSGTVMSHAAIGDTATSAAGNACDACHERNFGFYGVTIQFYRAGNSDSPTHALCGPAGTPTAPNVQICPATTGKYNGGSDCLTGCHQHQNQSKFSNYKGVSPKTPRKQIQSVTPVPVTPAVPQRARIGAITAATGVSGRFDHASASGQVCATCHNGSSAVGQGPTHLATNGACGDCHSTMGWRPVLRVDHADVKGTCVSCHNGVKATAKSALHPAAGIDCDRCHTTSAWKPAAYDHANVLAGTCATCHNALQAPAKPSNHVLTTLSCDTCHYVLGWTPVKPPVAAPVKPSIKPVQPLPSPSVRPRGAGAKTSVS